MADDDYRATLTDREIEIFEHPDDVDEKYFYRVVTRERKKIQKLKEDLKILDEHYPKLADEMREAVCEEDDTSIRLDRETWKRLNQQKEPGESFADVVNRLLDGSDSDE